MNHRDNIEYWRLVWKNFKAGDRSAFETIYNEFLDSLYAYGSKITSDKSLLEDAIQDVFIDVYTYGKTLRKPEYLEFYLFKTLKHNLFKKMRENSRFSGNQVEIDYFELIFPVEDFNDDKVILEERFQYLQNELKNLDAKKRELLFLKFNSELTYTEIGKLLDIKPDTAKKQVHRLLKYFRNKLTKTLTELFILCYKV